MPLAPLSLSIVIDVRRINDFGVGTYIRNLVQALGAVDPHNRYTLVISPARQPINVRDQGDCLL